MKFNILVFFDTPLVDSSFYGQLIECYLKFLDVLVRFFFGKPRPN